MKAYLLFGILGDDLHGVRSLVERALEIQMTLHESGYRCGEYYRLGDVGVEHFILQRNYDEVEGEWTEPMFTEYGLLLYVNETDRAAYISAILAPHARLLSTQEA